MEDQKNKIANFPASQKPHLRLFLSADIVGSTAFKQQPRSAELGKFPVWFTVVLGFYQNAEQSFSKHWRLYLAATSESKGLSDIFGEPPELWKTVGDEVLFSKRIDHPGQAIVALHAWASTLEELRKQLKEFGNLDVKSTAWIADFPLNNN